MLRGRLLAESLRLGADLTVPGLELTRLGRHDESGSTAGGQPAVWTFVDFTAPDDRADELAAALAEALLPDDGWYADFELSDEHVVVFARKVFRYRKGDQAARDEVVAYGRAAGTPEHQLDWGDQAVSHWILIAVFAPAHRRPAGSRSPSTKIHGTRPSVRRPDAPAR